MNERPAFESVLHPTDFSTGSEIAFAHALKLATASSGGTRFTIIHAEPAAEYGRHWRDFPAVRSTLERWGLLAPDSCREDVLAAVGVEVEKVAALGPDAVEAIDGFAASHPVALIVLATHGRSGLPRWLHPSVAERLALRSRIPTLFVPHGARGFVALADGQVRLRNILIPISSDPSPNAAVDAAAALARTLSPDPVRLSLLHVGEQANAPAPRPVRDPQFEWRRVSRTGGVVEEILAEAEGLEADLIAMSTRGHHGFLDALRGSTTEQIVRRAPCPVLAAPVSG